MILAWGSSGHKAVVAGTSICCNKYLQRRRLCSSDDLPVDDKDFVNIRPQYKELKTTHSRYYRSKNLLLRAQS